MESSFNDLRIVVIVLLSFHTAGKTCGNDPDLPSSISVQHRDRNLPGYFADGPRADFPIIPSIIDPCKGRPLKDQSSFLKPNTMLLEVAQILIVIPFKIQDRSRW